MLYCIRLLPHTLSTCGRIMPFKNFKKKYIKCTEQKYKNVIELEQNPPDAQLYIAGSDQIWNCRLPNGKDSAFYLQFGKKEIKRISYAASFGIGDVPEPYQEIVHKYLKSLDAISVREKTGLDILKQFNLYGTVAADPVFLLNSFEWRKICGSERLIKDEYLLVYHLFNQDPRMPQAVIRLATENNWKIVRTNSDSVEDEVALSLDNVRG